VLVLVPVFYLIYARIFGVSVDAVTAAERGEVPTAESLAAAGTVSTG
jgi:hypothetical protein